MEREMKGGAGIPSGPAQRVFAKQFVAESFALVDKAGRPRGAMVVGADGVAGLALFGKDGEIRASLAVKEDGTGEFSINGKVVRFEKEGQASMPLPSE
jgi:hypothetical protein